MIPAIFEGAELLPPLSGVPVGLGEGVEVASSLGTDELEELTMSGEGEGLTVTEEVEALALVMTEEVEALALVMTEEVEALVMTVEVVDSGSGWASAYRKSCT